MNDATRKFISLYENYNPERRYEAGGDKKGEKETEIEHLPGKKRDKLVDNYKSAKIVQRKVWLDALRSLLSFSPHYSPGTYNY
jgi:hypothetical protein